jgi:VWFA-related protein
MLLLMTAAISIAADKNKTGKEDKPKMPFFSVPVNVISIRATIKDKQGNPVTDLKQGDFKIYEDGKLQDINTFSQESYASKTQESSPSSKQDPLKEPERKSIAKPQAQAANLLIKPRMISLVVDDLMLDSLENVPRLIKAIQQYVENDIGPYDQIALLSSSGQVQVPFTDNRETLKEKIASLSGDLLPSIRSQECPNLTDQQAYRIAFLNDKLEMNKAVVNAFVCLNLVEEKNSFEQHSTNTDALEEEASSLLQNLRQAVSKASVTANMLYERNESRTGILLSTLRRHLRALSHFDAEKRVVFFSTGFLSESSSFSALQLQEVIERALNSKVIFNCVNIRGVETGMSAMDQRTEAIAFKVAQKLRAVLEMKKEADNGPEGETNSLKETLDSFPDTMEYVPSSDMITEKLDDANAKEGPLKQIAYDTGGQFFHNDNNIYKGIRQIIQSQSHDYILTYATDSKKPEGSYHRIKLEVSRPGLDISYRKGFYTPKEEMSFEKRKKEDIMDALIAPGSFNEIPISLSYNCFKQDEAIYGVSFLTRMEIDRLHFLNEDARHKNLISLVLAAYDENNKYIDGVEKTIDFRLLDKSYADLRQRGLSSRVELKLPIGRFKIKAVVRESVEGKMGSLTQTVEIP